MAEKDNTKNIPSEEELTDGLMEAWRKAGRIHPTAEQTERVMASTIASQLRTLLSREVRDCGLQNAGAVLVLAQHAKDISDSDDFVQVTRQAIQSLTGGRISFADISGERPDFNKTHPELRGGEMFFHNIDGNALGGSNFSARRALLEMHQKYSTLRVGQRAYSRTGKPLRELVPLFVQRSEIERLGEMALFE